MTGPTKRNEYLMTDFNIRQLIRDVLRSSTMADPGDVADEVMRRVPDDQIRVALSQVLRDAVRETMRGERLSHSFDVTDDSVAAKPNLRVTPDRPRVPNRSPKVAAIRDCLQMGLHDRILVGSGAR